MGNFFSNRGNFNFRIVHHGMSELSEGKEVTAINNRLQEVRLRHLFYAGKVSSVLVQCSDHSNDSFIYI
jgi:hypothetical protein